MKRQGPHPSCSRPTGFSMVEASASVLLVAILLVGALTAAGTSARLRLDAAQRDFAAALAADLAEEIAARAYGSTADGPIPTTALSGTRAQVTTIDEYNGLVEDPPVTASGKSIAGSEGWSRVTTVQRVVGSAPQTSTTSETGVKRVRVEVIHGKSPMHVLTFLRTARWDSARN